MRGARLSLPIALALAAGAACPGATPRKVSIVLSLHGANGRPVHGFDVTVALPAGSRVDHDPATKRIASRAIVPGGGASSATVDGRFASHATAPSIRLLVASTAPLKDGELATVELTVASAVAPSRGSFEVVRAAVAGPDGASVPGATGWVSAVEPR